ncbi:MAG: hypothetical protein WA964_13040 [Ilumatobacter sp.]
MGIGAIALMPGTGLGDDRNVADDRFHWIPLASIEPSDDVTD